jgi:hypothetical protein
MTSMTVLVVFAALAGFAFPAGHSVTYGISAICRARLIAVCSLRWCLAQVPEMRRGRILPRSGTNGPISLTSL